MYVNKVKILLNELDIQIIDEGVIIYHDNNGNIPLENHYAIRLNENNNWEFCFVQLERRNLPEYRQIKEFHSKEEALTYFFLDRLRDYFMTNIVSKKVDFSVKNWNQEILKERLEVCNITQGYIFYENIYSLNSFEENGDWYNSLSDREGKIIVVSPPLADKNTAYLSTFRRIYLLHLFFQYLEKERVKQCINEKFTDMEIARYLKYNL
ncbi:hypothetical protein [Lacrimispora sp.]|uniref:hypothetical protein n=1 Tax=Lacrimispora sp. TaxID=2719234 RepID=UPI002898191D|nr:hypothetical protein [Lacrimispora sp.]